MTHEPECDVAWKWPDFMGGRGIDGSDCWMCDLIRSVREDERASILTLSDRVKDSQYKAALRDADAVVAAMPTALWINANTDEAQGHKRYVRAAIKALGGER